MESYEDLRASFSEEHAPRREHDVPWIYFPSVSDVAECAAMRVGRFLQGLDLGSSNLVYTTVQKLHALRNLVHSTP
jgi:hypothetical protein